MATVGSNGFDCTDNILQMVDNRVEFDCTNVGNICCRHGSSNYSRDNNGSMIFDKIDHLTVGLDG